MKLERSGRVPTGPAVVVDAAMANRDGKGKYVDWANIAGFWADELPCPAHR